MDIYVKNFLLMIVFTLIMSSAFGQDYIEARILSSDENSYVEWLPDGSAKVTGTVTFISPIKKYTANPGVNVTSSEMIIVNPNAYMSRSTQEIKVVDNAVIKHKTVRASRDQVDPESENGRWFIKMSDESPVNGHAQFKVIRRAALTGIDDSNNSYQHNFGFVTSTDDWVIFGGQYTENFADDKPRLSKLDGFSIRPFGERLTGSTYNSTDYVKLFNKWHLTNGAWIDNAIYNHPFRTTAVVGGGLLFFHNPGAEFEAIEVLSEVADAESQALIESDRAAEILKRAARQASDANESLRTAYIQKGVGMIVAMSTAYLGDGTDGYGSYIAENNTFFNNPEEADYLEFPDGSWFGTKTHLWTFNPTNQACVTSVNSGPCKFQINVPVVVQAEVTDAVVERLSFPGASGGKTMYQLFGKLGYHEGDPVQVEVLSGQPSTINSEMYFGKLDQSLPTRLYVPTSGDQNYEVELSFEINGFGLYTFHVASTLSETAFIENLPNLPNLNKYITDLGAYSGSYRLYQIQANHPKIHLQLDENNILAGDNIFILNPEEYEDVVINNGSNQAMFGTDATNTTEDAELTVRGDVLMFDSNDTKSQSALVATENWQLYVGGKDNARGIIAEDFSITGRSEFLLPDFVFAPDYSLYTLNQMERYLKENKHMPHVPSQSDISDNGYYSVQHMMYGQLQNLEELYLHAFRQEAVIGENDIKRKSLEKRLIAITKSIEQLENGRK